MQVSLDYHSSTFGTTQPMMLKLCSNGGEDIQNIKSSSTEK